MFDEQDCVLVQPAESEEVDAFAVMTVGMVTDLFTELDILDTSKDAQCIIHDEGII